MRLRELATCLLSVVHRHTLLRWVDSMFCLPCISAKDVETDRFKAVRALQDKYGGVILLKGAGTLVCGPDHVVSVTTEGNPGMASGGMGDTLTGIITGGLALVYANS